MAHFEIYQTGPVLGQKVGLATSICGLCGLRVTQ